LGNLVDKRQKIVKIPMPQMNRAAKVSMDYFLAGLPQFVKLCAQMQAKNK
jgi:hypothetical protein